MRQPPPPVPQLSTAARIRGVLGLDGAVSFAVGGRAWSLLSYPLTVYLLGTRLNAAERGFFFSFSSVTGLQIFLELGFSMSVLQFASHEFSRLRILPSGAIAGDADSRSRLVSLGRLAIKYYAVMAVVFVGVVGAGGHWFFGSNKEAALVDWTVPWWSLCLFAGCNLAAMPLYSLLEGCNEVTYVNACRVLSQIGFSVCLWAGLAAGSRLYSTVFSSAGMLLAPLVLVLWRWRGFFREFASPPAGPTISWGREIWPFQWKIALSAMSGYLVFQLFNPALLRYRGAAEAGRMGMTLQAVNALTTIAYSWVSTKAPRYGMLVKARKFAELDRLSSRSILQSCIVCASGGCAFLGVLWFLRAHSAWGGKFLGFDSVCLLLVAALATVAVFGQAVYLRAHKKEPFMILSVANALLTSAAVVIGARSHGSPGACAGYAIVQALVFPVATAITRGCRRRWHHADL